MYSIPILLQYVYHLESLNIMFYIVNRQFMTINNMENCGPALLVSSLTHSFWNCNFIS